MAKKSLDVRVGLEKIKAKLVIKNRKRLLIVLGIVTAAITFIATYVFLMPINLSSGGFKFYLVLMLLLWSIPLVFKSEKAGVRPKIKSGWGVPLLIALFVIVLLLVLAFAVSPLFMAKEYRDLIAVADNGNFVEGVENYDTMQIPVVDRDLAAKLGDKKLGEDNYGSQFEVDIKDYSMISHKDSLYWVAPIEYRGFFQWTNKAASPGYVMINALDQSDVQIVRYEMNYVSSAYLWDDLNRKVYFSNMFRYREGKPHLELDDNGKPMFVDAVLKKRFVFTSGVDTVGVIITDPTTGKSKFYKTEEVPAWVNRIQPVDMVSDQLGYWGRYVAGFFNALFAKKDVLEVSTGINYVYNNGNMYFQTGMTSVGNDESIVGVTMVNMRTKETVFYRVAGATEYAAAQSAIGAEQAQRFSSSDPIMINFNGIPTYFMMLKDDEGLVKRYAYVNVEDYRLVSVNTDRLAALAGYEMIVSPTSVTRDLELTVSAVGNVFVDGNTVFYLRFERPDNAELPENFATLNFKAPLSLTTDLVFLRPGDRVTADILIGSSENLITALRVHKSE